MFTRFLITICALALTATLSIAEEESSWPSEKLGAYALSSLYALSPENPWHIYFIDEGEMPLALYTVKQHLITVDSSMKERFEDDQLLETILLAFAAYFRAHGNVAWERVYTHIENACQQMGDFFSEEDKNNAINDIALALEDYIATPYYNDAEGLWESVLAQIPWFLEGIPPYLAEHLRPKVEVETGTEVVIIDEDTVLSHEATLTPLLQIEPPVCAGNTETEKHNCKESLEKVWNEKIRPFLKKTRNKVSSFIKKIKDSKEYNKLKTEFDKAERDVRQFRKEAVKEIKNFFKKW